MADGVEDRTLHVARGVLVVMGPAVTMVVHETASLGSLKVYDGGVIGCRAVCELLHGEQAHGIVVCRHGASYASPQNSRRLSRLTRHTRPIFTART